MPDHIFRFPVLIEVAGSHGTGFLLNDDAGLFLVTARHVLFKDGIGTYGPKEGGPVQLTSLCEAPDGTPLDQVHIGDFKHLTLDCEQLMANGLLAKHTTADVAVCKLATFGKVLGEGYSGSAIELVYSPGVTEDGPDKAITGVDVKFCFRFAEVSLAAPTLLLGYPTSLAGTDFDRNLPLLRTGIVAGKTRSGQIVVDCPVYFGNSGALVVTIIENKYRALGVAVKMVPFKETIYSQEFKQPVGVRYENSGYTIVEPMDRVFELLENLQAIRGEATE
ncbi:hypothetical protein HL667_06175 [Bradyrhizobium sp. 83012]|uniref:Serine protease n=1 Tax=Bradyrhizobium aeschynomenes TaxID=2734909 RepID=A0ABX2C8I4_9BRAD|nr:trypsin-like peptidase domain-containing protein [Bradyrhizobium aeschynomenes]NPU64579.1 hypothetical protein [Bradyrhizobium aeschynomenes]